MKKTTTLALVGSLSLAANIAFAHGDSHDSHASELTVEDCSGIIANAIAGANVTASAFRAPPATAKMQIACLDRRGKIIQFHSMDDAWVGSIDIAKAKAYTAAALSSDQNALTSRDIGVASQPGGPLWQLGNSNRPGTQGKENIKERGFIEFPGGLPLYKNGGLVGGIGVSGDSVDVDETVAVCGAAGFEPAPAIRSDTILGLPYTTTTCPL